MSSSPCCLASAPSADWTSSRPAKGVDAEQNGEPKGRLQPDAGGLLWVKVGHVHRRPCSWSQRARWAAVVDFPTPWFRTAIRKGCGLLNYCSKQARAAARVNPSAEQQPC